ncbi:echinoderm microtubule-associated protein-like 1 [Cladochytrium replicatum]|nr:echinoderm microtubule-associated protein-like 1 [Cladochytrium replicatum]
MIREIMLLQIYILYAEDMRQAFIQKYVKRKGVATNKHGVEVVRFSPNGQFLAVGGHDLVVDLYDVPSGLKYIGSCKGHSSYIIQMDFSVDSAFIQKISADYELLFWSIPTCKQITSASAMKDVAWETYTCVLGWPVQGIWEKGMDGTDINAADRSPDQTFLVSGDDFNNVRLHVYPASKAGLPCKKFRAHSSHVTETEVTCTNSYVLSTGGIDGCLMQWRVKHE